MANLDLKRIKDFCETGFTKYSGINITRLEEGRAFGEMEITENHLNPLDTVHGGAVFSLADVIGGIATRTLDIYPTTCSSTINYMRPTMGCTKLMADAKVIKQGKTISVVDISVTDQNNTEIAHVLANYYNLEEHKKTY